MIKKVIQYIQFFLTLIWVFFICSTVATFGAVLRCRRTMFHAYWAQLSSESLRVRYHRHPDSKQVQKNKRTIVLLNHRTQSDFFLHEYVTEFSCNYLSRWMVGVIFPMSIIGTYCFGRTVWFFRRGKNDLEQFYQWCDKMFGVASRGNLLVYPEGHRMGSSDTPAPLKKGMIAYAYSRKYDVQIIQCFGGEKILYEKKLYSSWSSHEVTYHVDSVIDPKQFADFDSFFKEVQNRFSSSFVKTLDSYRQREKKNQ